MIPEPIQRGEDAAQRWEAENTEGDKFKCGCGNWEELRFAQTVSPDPYAEPVCNDCFGQWMAEMEAKQVRDLTRMDCEEMMVGYGEGHEIE